MREFGPRPSREIREIAAVGASSKLSELGPRARGWRRRDFWLVREAALFAGLTPDTAQRTDRLRNNSAGLAASLRLTGTGTQEPLWARLGEITMPTLVLAGELDDKFTAVGRRITAAISSSTFMVVAGAGHSVHLERPEATADIIAGWLHRTGLVPSADP